MKSQDFIMKYLDKEKNDKIMDLMSVNLNNNFELDMLQQIFLIMQVNSQIKIKMILMKKLKKGQVRFLKKIEEIGLQNILIRRSFTLFLNKMQKTYPIYNFFSQNLSFIYLLQFSKKLFVLKFTGTKSQFNELA